MVHQATAGHSKLQQVTAFWRQATAAWNRWAATWLLVLPSHKDRPNSPTVPSQCSVLCSCQCIYQRQSTVSIDCLLCRHSQGNNSQEISHYGILYLFYLLCRGEPVSACQPGRHLPLLLLLVVTSYPQTKQLEALSHPIHLQNHHLSCLHEIEAVVQQKDCGGWWIPSAA